MSEYLDAARVQVEARSVSAETLVLLYRAAEEAEQGGEVERLEEATRLAGQAATSADDALRSDADRLYALCEERLERARAHRAGPPACPGCGRPLDVAAVRCRACGTLLV